jgi:HEAT repeat protein
VRIFAVQAIGDIGPPAAPAVPRLTQLLDDPATADSAVEALGGIGSAARDALPALQRLAKSLQREWRRMQRTRQADPDFEETDETEEFQSLVQGVATAIQQIESPLPDQKPRKVPFHKASIPDLVAALRDRDDRTAIAANCALIRHSDAVVPELAPLLSHPEVKVRARALAVLRELGPKAVAALPVLIAGFADEEVYTPGTAMKELFRKAAVAIGTAAIPSLQQASKSRNRLVRDCASAALLELGQKS